MIIDGRARIAIMFWQGLEAGLGARDVMNRAIVEDWRYGERLRIDSELHALADRLVARFSAEIEKVGWRDLLMPGSSLQAEIKRSLVAEMNRAYDRERRKIDETLKSSLRLVDGAGGGGGFDLMDTAGLAASGILAVGALVGAASAVTLATSVTTTAFLFTTTAFSWPLFLGIGAAAAATAYASPAVMGTVLVRLRAKAKRQIVYLVEARLIGGPRSRPEECVRAALFKTVDDISRQRLSIGQT